MTINLCGKDFDEDIILKTFANFLVIDSVLVEKSDLTYDLLVCDSTLSLHDKLTKCLEVTDTIAKSNLVCSASAIAGIRLMISAARHVTLQLIKSYKKIDPDEAQRSRLPSGIERHRLERSDNLDLMIDENGNAVKKKMKTSTKSTKEILQKDDLPKAKFTENDYNLALKWVKLAEAKTPWLKHSPEKFANSIRLLRSNIGITPEGMEAVFEFIVKDRFWADVATSPASLMQTSSRNGMRKIDNILRSMKARETKTNQVARAEEKIIYDKTDEWNPFDEL